MNTEFPFPGPRNGLTLATVVIDETHMVDQLPEGVTRVQSVYLFAARVAMHICSFTGGTDAHFLESVVTEHGDTCDLSDKAEAFRDECEQADRSHDNGYRHLGFIDVDTIDPRRIAKVGTYTVRDMLTFLREGDFASEWEDRIAGEERGPDRIQALHETFIYAMAQSHSSDAHPTPAACFEIVAACLDKLAEARRLTCYAETAAILGRVA